MENEKILSNEELMEITAGLTSSEMGYSVSEYIVTAKYGVMPGHYPILKYGVRPRPGNFPILKYGINPNYK